MTLHPYCTWMCAQSSWTQESRGWLFEGSPEDTSPHCLVSAYMKRNTSVRAGLGLAPRCGLTHCFSPQCVVQAVATQVGDVVLYVTRQSENVERQHDLETNPDCHCGEGVGLGLEEVGVTYCVPA